MLRMLDWLRVNIQAGRIRKVVTFDAATAHDNAERNRTMAKNLESLEPSGADVVIALTGSAHAQKVKYEDGKVAFAPAAMLLPNQATTSILIEGDGGNSYSCEDSGCHVYPIVSRPAATRVLLIKPAGRGFDGVLELGTAETASLPANPN
jgi:hypothetical protein